MLDQHLAMEKGIIPYEDEELEEDRWAFTGKKPVNWNPSYIEKKCAWECISKRIFLTVFIY
ncbi:hypothetical protein HMPREF1210_02198 [Paenisporosarcina sp. HGH0030]|nr:hypothetical protein HMPREF1210_02198 [Paenisporosarcina sp. HGH0030]